MSKLPIYDIVLQDDDLKQGVGRISLVDEPAIGVDWIKLKKQEDCTECLEGEDPCYEGYVQVGMKILDGKEVPNCVPIVDGKPEPPTKLKKQNTIELDFSVTLTDKGLCFGCPPNGDGTTSKGEPDKRCKGDGADKGSGTAGGAKGGSKASIKKATLEPEIKSVQPYTNLNGSSFPRGVEVSNSTAILTNDRTGDRKEAVIPVKPLVAFYPDDKKIFDKLSKSDQNKITDAFKDLHNRSMNVGRVQTESYVTVKVDGNSQNVRIVSDTARRSTASGYEDLLYHYVQDWDR